MNSCERKAEELILYAHKKGGTWFQLSEKGMLFARRGCFTGEARRDQLVKIGAIAAIIVAIAGIIQLFL